MLLLLLLLPLLSTADPLFGGDPVSLFSLPDATGDKFSGLEFHPGGGSSPILESGFKGSFSSESADLPLYTDGRPSSGSRQGRAEGGLRPNYPPPSLGVGYGAAAASAPAASSPSQQRAPRFRSQPFSKPSFASNVRAEPYSAGSSNIKVESPFPSAPERRSQPQIQTGFVPIFKDSKRAQQPTPPPSAVLKDLPPPILTAESVTARPQPTLFRVSASVQSTPRVQAPSPVAQQSNGSSGQPQQQRARALLLADGGGQHVRVTSSVTSESVVSRVVSSSAGGETRRKKKKTTTLDVDCDGSRDLGWCELGDKYPRKYVEQVVAACQDVIQRMYVEVPHNFDKLADSSDFRAQLNNSSSSREARERGGRDAWSWAAYLQEGSLCDAERGFLRPETAKDTSGKWNIVVQTDAIRQRVPVAMCRKSSGGGGGACQKMLECGVQRSQCVQKYNYHLLLSLNPTQKHDCPFMKLYRLPSACACHAE